MSVKKIKLLLVLCLLEQTMSFKRAKLMTKRKSSSLLSIRVKTPLQKKYHWIRKVLFGLQGPIIFCH